VLRTAEGTSSRSRLSARSLRQETTMNKTRTPQTITPKNLTPMSEHASRWAAAADRPLASRRRVADDADADAERITARNNELLRNGEMTASEAREFERNVDELEAYNALATEWNTVTRNPAAFAQASDDDYSGRGDLDSGRWAIDRAFNAGHLPAEAAEKAAALIDNGTDTDRSLAAQWASAAGSEHYRTAFAKLMADPVKGHLTWTAQEGDAYRATARVQNAMSTTAGNGGYMIPLTLDPAIMLTNDGSNNPLRQLATVKQTMTDAWQGVTSAGATSEWKEEAAEAADGSPTLGNPSIPVFFGDSFLPYSYEVGMDADNFLGELVDVLRDSADNLMATAYTTGNGTTAPQGIVTGLAGTASEINTTGSETLDVSDPYALQNALPARFSAGATWQAHIATMNAYRRFETTNGAHEFPELRQNPPYLLGKRFFENSNMDGAINAAATANNYALIYGDVRRGFFIVDRVGSTIELIPNLMGENGRPTGQRGALLWFRTGSKVVVPQALRLLDVPTAA
jgi:HK97 family phage major capsid protein